MRWSFGREAADFRGLARCRIRSADSTSCAGQLRVEESNLDLHVQSVVSCRLDDPGRRAPPSIPARRRSAQQANAGCGSWSRPVSRPPESERCFLCHSPTLRPWIVVQRLRGRHSTSYVEGLWSPSLGARRGKTKAKADANASVSFHATLRVFLSQAGPRFHLALLQAEHHLAVPFVSDRLSERKRRPVGSPSTGSFCG